MNEIDMLTEICAGRFCNNCPAKKCHVRCYEVSLGKANSDDIFAIENIYYELHPEKNHTISDISEDDITAVFEK